MPNKPHIRYIGRLAHAFSNHFTHFVVLHKESSSYTVFTWLNAVATIVPLLNFDAATIQGRPLIEGGVYCTEALSVQLLFNIV